MFKISVWHGDLSESYLRYVTQLGVDCLDFGSGDYFPGVKEQGYPDLDAVIKIRKKIRSWGLDFNRVTLPDITEKFMSGEDDGEKELENTAAALEVFAEAGAPIARQRFHGDVFPWMLHRWNSPRRGGYHYRAESRSLAESDEGPPSLEQLDVWWARFCTVYERLVPIAEDRDIKLAIHPFGLAAAGYAAGGTGFSQGHRRLSQPPSRVPLLLRHSRRGRGFALSARRGSQLRAQGPDFHGAFAQCARELGHGRWV